jgi:hypothetical protein
MSVRDRSAIHDMYCCAKKGEVAGICSKVTVSTNFFVDSLVRTASAEMSVVDRSCFTSTKCVQLSTSIGV